MVSPSTTEAAQLRKEQRLSEASARQRVPQFAQAVKKVVPDKKGRLTAGAKAKTKKKAASIQDSMSSSLSVSPIKNNERIPAFELSNDDEAELAKELFPESDKDTSFMSEDLEADLIPPPPPSENVENEETGALELENKTASRINEKATDADASSMDTGKETEVAKKLAPIFSQSAAKSNEETISKKKKITKKTQSKSTSKTKPKTKVTNKEREEAEEESDDDTVAAANTDKFRRVNMVYVDLQMEMKASTKPVELLRSRLIESFKILKELDDSTIFQLYEKTGEEETNAWVAPKDLPTTMSQIQKYVAGYRPRNDEHTAYLQARIAFDRENVEDYLQDSRALLVGVNSKLYLRHIQTPHVSPVGWLHGSYDKIDVDHLQGFLETCLVRIDAVKKIVRQSPLLLGSKDKPIWNGVNKSARLAGAKGVRAVHLDCELGKQETVKAYLKLALKSQGFQQEFGIKMFLVPVMTNGDSPHQKEKLKIAIRKQDMIRKCLTHAFTWEILTPDRRVPALQNVTLRKLLFKIKSPETKETLFYGLDKKWGRDGGWTVTFPRKYEEEAREWIAQLPAYLHHEHGEPAFKWFTTEAIDRARDTEWDDEKDRPVPPEERELDEINDGTMDLSWVDMSFILMDEKDATKTSVARPQKKSQEAVYNLDDRSTSTFGTAVSQGAWQPNGREATTIVTPAADNTDAANDERSVGSLGSLGSKASVLAAEMQGMKESMAEQQNSMDSKFAAIMNALGQAADHVVEEHHPHNDTDSADASLEASARGA